MNAICIAFMMLGSAQGHEADSGLRVGFYDSHGYVKWGTLGEAPSKQAAEIRTLLQSGKAAEAYANGIDDIGQGLHNPQFLQAFTVAAVKAGKVVDALEIVGSLITPYPRAKGYASVPEHYRVAYNYLFAAATEERESGKKVDNLYEQNSQRWGAMGIRAAVNAPKIKSIPLRVMYASALLSMGEDSARPVLKSLTKERPKLLQVRLLYARSLTVNSLVIPRDWDPKKPIVMPEVDPKVVGAEIDAVQRGLPNWPEVHYFAASYYRERDKPRAKNHLKQFLKVADPNDSRIPKAKLRLAELGS